MQQFFPMNHSGPNNCKGCLDITEIAENEKLSIFKDLFTYLCFILIYKLSLCIVLQTGVSLSPQCPQFVHKDIFYNDIIILPGTKEIIRNAFTVFCTFSTMIGSLQPPSIFCDKECSIHKQNNS